MRSNINKRFQKNKNSFIQVKNSEHTLVGKGNIAGWQIIKMIPIRRELFYEVEVRNNDLILAIKEMKRRKLELRRKCFILLTQFEKRNKIYGAIDFNYYFDLLFK